MNQIRQIALHVFQIIHTNVFVYQGEDAIVAFDQNNLFEPLKSWLMHELHQFHEDIKDTPSPIVTKRLKFIDFNFLGITTSDYQIVIGPYLVHEHVYRSVQELSRLLRSDAEVTTYLSQYFDELKILSPDDMRFLHQSFTYYHAYDQTLEIATLTPKAVRQINEDMVYENLEESKVYIKKNYELEDKMMDALKKGDVESLTDILNRMDENFYLPERVPHDTLRNSKNQLIIANTLCTRRAIEGGLDIYHAHEISNTFGIEIEKIRSINQTSILSRKIAVTFAKAVRDYQTCDYPAVIKEALQYIYRHKNEKITLTTLSDYVYLSKEHLSRLFKKHLNETVNQTIMQYKILEAKKLMALREFSFTDIANQLSFSSPAHFSTQFKQITGMTPKTYCQTL